MRRFIIDTDTASDDAAAVWPDFVREKVSCHCHCCTEQGHAYGQVIFYQKGRTYEAIPEISSFNAEVITKIDEQVFTENWCSVKISDTDFVEFPSIKSVSCSSMLPF